MNYDKSLADKVFAKYEEVRNDMVEFIIDTIDKNNGEITANWIYNHVPYNDSLNPELEWIDKMVRLYEKDDIYYCEYITTVSEELDMLSSNELFFIMCQLTKP